MRPLPAAARVSPAYGAAQNVQILGVSIPFFSVPSTKDSKARAGDKASSGSVYPLIETRQVEGDTWYQVSTPKGPLWIVGESDGAVYASLTDKPAQVLAFQETTSNGWPAFKSREDAREAMGAVSVPLKMGNKQIYVAKGTGSAFAEMIRWWDQNVEPVRLLSSYNYRGMASDRSKLSLHSSGTAIDINGCWRGADGRLVDGCSLPYGERTITDEGLRSRIRAKAEELGLKWGGDWGGTSIDEMHFEVKMDPVGFRAFWDKRLAAGPAPVIAPVTTFEKVSDAARSLLPGNEQPKPQLAREVEEYAKFFIPLGIAVAVGAVFLLRSPSSQSSYR
jgi:hypothetical protein